MKVLHLVYKHLYTTHIEPLWKAEREKGVISKRSTTYSEAIDIPFDEFRAKCYDFLQSSDPFESDDAQGLFREIEAQPLLKKGTVAAFLKVLFPLLLQQTRKLEMPVPDRKVKGKERAALYNSSTVRGDTHVKPSLRQVAYVREPLP